MALDKHRLFETLLLDVTGWLPAGMTIFDDLGKLLQEKSQSALHRYQIGSFIRCDNMAKVFVRLEGVADMTGRSVHKRKHEDRDEFLKKWMVYHYGYYVSIYQSTVDVAAVLVNQILDLGYQIRQCNFTNVYSNEHVKAAGIDKILEQLRKTTEEHSKGKNLLLHRGEEVAPPLQKVKPSVFPIAKMATALGMSQDVVTRQVKEYLAVRNRTQLSEKMRSECGDLETQVEPLFDKLLPHYIKMRSFYGGNPN
jgi:hypothetical protein